jgi:hypothetical protein
MEFDDIKKLWHTQTDKPLFDMNNTLLHEHVMDRQRTTTHITQVSELLLIIVNLASATFIFIVTRAHGNNIYLLILSVWLAMSGAWVLYQRVRRLRGERNFDRSLHDEMNHTLSIATYQVRLARLGRLNALPTGVLTLLSLWEAGHMGWSFAVIPFFLIAAYVVAGWETNIYVRRKKELELLKKKFDESKDADDAEKS